MAVAWTSQDGQLPYDDSHLMHLRPRATLQFRPRPELVSLETNNDNRKTRPQNVEVSPTPRGTMTPTGPSTPRKPRKNRRIASNDKVHNFESYPTPSVSSKESTECRHPSSPWTFENDKKLMSHRAQNMNWVEIATHFSGKTPNGCRKRHERLMEKRSQESWDDGLDDDLASAYLEAREDMWKMVSDRVGEKWQLVEAKVSINRPTQHW